MYSVCLYTGAKPARISLNTRQQVCHAVFFFVCYIHHVDFETALFMQWISPLYCDISPATAGYCDCDFFPRR